MMSEHIVFCGKLLHPKQMPADQRIIGHIHQIIIRRVKPRLRIRKHEEFILLHAEKESPALIPMVIPVNYRQPEIHSGHSLKQ